MPSSVPSKQPKNLRKSHCGLQWLCVTPARHVDWLARFLAATLSQQYDRGLSNNQSDFISMCVVGSASILSGTAIFWRIAISLHDLQSVLETSAIVV